MESKTNYTKSVTGVVIKDGKVLLARHTYGAGKNMLVVPGGYVDYGEAPEDAVKREYLEETKIVVEPREIIGIRFNMHDWYVAFRAEYVSGEAVTDGDENSEVIWLDVEEALCRDDVANLTKELIKLASCSKACLVADETYAESGKYAPYSFYGAKGEIKA
ncbi:MAG: NUDIX domain-containing protein [Clostridia bacterium]|nr:NUDIX domain-containing protein [Clostridia bacterium]